MSLPAAACSLKMTSQEYSWISYMQKKQYTKCSVKVFNFGQKFLFSVCSNKVLFPLSIWHTLRHLVSKNDLIVKYVGISCTYTFLTHMMKLQFICLLKPYPYFKSFLSTSQMGDICKGKQTFQTLYNSFLHKL